MKLNVEGLQALIKIIDFGSFHEAAEALCISRSALSRRISGLENDLAVKLIERTTRSVRLTAAGRDFLPQARHIVGELESALSNFRKSGSGSRDTVVLACIPSTAIGILPPVLKQYSTLYPERRVRVLDVYISEVFKAVSTGEADFGLTTLTLGNDHNLDLQELLRDRFVAGLRRSDPLAKYKQVKWSQIAGRRLILAGRSGGDRALFDFELPARIVGKHWAYELHHSYFAIYGLVESGAGIAVLPDSALPPHYPGLVFRPLVEPVVTRTIHVVKRRDSEMSVAARDFLELIKSHCSSR